MKKQTKILFFTLAATSLASLSVKAQPPTIPPFSCTGLAYQVAGQGGNSSLFSFDITTVARDSIGPINKRVNATGYNSFDDYIWGYDMDSNKVVQIGADATSISHTIPHLPSALYNVGDVFGDSYLLLYQTDGERYFVVDIKNTRSTYLQLVNPTNGFGLANSPYGNKFAGNETLNISDFAYSPTTGNFYGMIPGTANAAVAYRIVTFRPYHSCSHTYQSCNRWINSTRSRTIWVCFYRC